MAILNYMFAMLYGFDFGFGFGFGFVFVFGFGFGFGVFFPVAPSTNLTTSVSSLFP